MSGKLDGHIPIGKDSQMAKLREIDGIDVGSHMIFDHSRLKDSHRDFHQYAIERYELAAPSVRIS